MDYQPNAKCPRWLQFLDEVFGRDKEVIEWVHQAVGYSLTGLVNEHMFVICYGQGRNGKGVFCEMKLALMGEYADPADFEAFLAADKSSVRAQEAVGRLRGLRFALASETGNNRRFSEALIKRLTGGDKLIGAKLRGDAYSFYPTHKLWFECNHLPANKDATVGMWERVRVLPFNQEFLGDKQDKQLVPKLFKEQEGIFAWMVEGAQKYLKAGRLPPLPKSMEEAINEYRNDNDTLRLFIQDRLERNDGNKLGIKEVHDAYLNWCRTNNDDNPIPVKFFRKNMGERGIAAKEIHKQWYFLGYRLKVDPQWLDLDTSRGGLIGYGPEHEDEDGELRGAL